ncbi:hypothetical protein B296_00002061 [Ensete ventricosum]|uniref:Uncharacterized protein n=1 Tax=Ensete ventricosum TaxID=4639 RepID=A0A427B4F7_ENSVE|nr:hypothetical protein B296_00002061 [Ensete ventricosum]
MGAGSRGGSGKQQRCCCVWVERKAAATAAWVASGDAGAGDDNSRGMTTAHGQRSRTCGGVPFLLKMPTTMREGTSMVGKNGIWQPTTTGGEMQAMGAALMVAATDDVGLRRL